MTALTGGDVAVRHAEIADMAMPLLVQFLHQGADRPFIVVTHGGKSAGIARQQHQRCLPRFQHIVFNAAKAKKHHTVDVAALQHTEMFFHHLRRKLAFHHDRVVTLLVKRREHGLYRQVFRQGIKTRNDNRDHFVALPAHGACGTGRGKTVLIHDRLDALTRALADTTFVVQHARHGGFTHAA
ncbi:hypothetical protein D3C78_1012590 [compost metagenome]